MNIGGTYLQPLPKEYGMPCPVFLKLEGGNPSLSMKIRSAWMILKEARLEQGDTVIESTSGNMGTGLALAAEELGLNAILVTDPKLSPWHQRYMLTCGATVTTVREQDESGGWLRTRLDYVRQKLKENPDWFWPNQYANALAPLAFETLGSEIVSGLRLRGYTPELNRLWLVCSVGTGGSLTGVARAVRRLWRHSGYKTAYVFAVDAEGSRIFGRPIKPRYLNGVGSALTPAELPNLRRELIDDVVIVRDAEAFAECWRAQRGFGINVGGSSGAVIKAIKQRSPYFNENDVVVGVCPDHGEIYAETLYNTEWLRERHLLDEVIRCAG